MNKINLIRFNKFVKNFSTIPPGAKLINDFVTETEHDDLVDFIKNQRW